jgi:hypothetical protein
LKQEAGKVDHGLMGQWRLVHVSIIEKIANNIKGAAETDSAIHQTHLRM